MEKKNTASLRTLVTRKLGSGDTDLYRFYRKPHSLYKTPFGHSVKSCRRPRNPIVFSGLLDIDSLLKSKEKLLGHLRMRQSTKTSYPKQIRSGLLKGKDLMFRLWCGKSSSCVSKTPHFLKPLNAQEAIRLAGVKTPFQDARGWNQFQFPYSILVSPSLKRSKNQSRLFFRAGTNSYYLAKEGLAEKF